jgi:hypothetical protein
VLFEHIDELAAKMGHTSAYLADRVLMGRGGELIAENGALAQLAMPKNEDRVIHRMRRLLIDS